MTKDEALAKEKALQALHDENERLGLYKDAYAEQEPVAYGMWDTMIGCGGRMMYVRLDKGQDGCTVPLYTHPLVPTAQPEQEPVRLRRGNILRCIETNELCTVWSTSTTGKTLVKWGANSFGEYTAEQIGELFWLEPEPDNLELAAEKSDNYAAFHAGYRFAVAHHLAQPEQEPVAWMNNKDFEPIRVRIMQEAYELADRNDSEGYNAIKVMCGDVQRMLPPQRTWVDLTHEQFAEILCDDRWRCRPELMLLQVQDKLKNKNL